MEKMGRENSLEEDLRSLPFAGLPFSYEGRFSALFAEEDERNLNGNDKRGGWGREIDQISDDSFRGLFPFPLIARYKIVPLVAVLVVVLLGSFALVKNVRLEQPTGIPIYHSLIRNGNAEIPLKFAEKKKGVPRPPSESAAIQYSSRGKANEFGNGSKER